MDVHPEDAVVVGCLTPVLKFGTAVPVRTTTALKRQAGVVGRLNRCSQVEHNRFGDEEQLLRRVTKSVVPNRTAVPTMFRCVMATWSVYGNAVNGCRGNEAATIIHTRSRLFQNRSSQRKEALIF